MKGETVNERDSGGENEADKAVVQDVVEEKVME